MKTTNFLHEIAANPADESARLVYADWLEDRGDARAEFVRVQCELARQERPDERTPALLAAEARLLSANRVDWLNELRTCGVRDAWFVKGVVSRIEMRIHDFLHYGRLLFQIAPTIRALTVCGLRRKGARELLTRLLRSRHFHRIRELDFSRQRIGSDGLLVFTKGSHLDRIESLDLSNCGLRDHHDIDALARGTSLNALTRLSLAGNELTGRSAECIAASDVARQLTYLDLSHNQLRHVGSMAIASSQCFRELRELKVVSTQFSELASLELAASSHFPKLTTLHISRTSQLSAAALGHRFGLGLRLASDRSRN